MRTLLCGVALAVFSGAASAQDSGADHWDARLTAVSGDVVVHPAGGGKDFEGEADLPLVEGDRVTTAAGSTAEIALDGGSLLALRERSDFTLDHTAKSASIFSLTLGSLLAKIQKLGSQRLSVRSPSSVAAVRGTEFGVDVEDDRSHVGVFDEGRVEVSGLAGGAVVLAPNQETSVARGQAPSEAVALTRFAARREQMRAQIRRLEIVRGGWKQLAEVRRLKARAAALPRLRRRREQLLEKGARQDRGSDDERRRDDERRPRDSK